MEFLLGFIIIILILIIGFLLGINYKNRGDDKKSHATFELHITGGFVSSDKEQ